MTKILLALLNVQLAGVLVYAANEWRSASFYRRQHLRLQDDRLWTELLTEARLRGKRVRPIVAGLDGYEHGSANGETAEQIADGSHGSSFPGQRRG